MLLQTRFLDDYYGIYRKIVFNSKHNRIRIYFDVAFNNDMYFEYSKTYRTEEDAFGEIETFIKSEVEEKTKTIPNARESMPRVNEGVNRFIAEAILDDEVINLLPNKDYYHETDKKTKEYLKTLLEKNTEWVGWD